MTEMDFKYYLEEQTALHASTQPQDIVKQCYQAAFGAEHLLDDLSAARDSFLREYAMTPEGALPLFAYISPEVCRVNLAAWKHSGLPEDWLFRMFVLTAKGAENGSERLLQYLSAADRWVHDGNGGFPYSEWETYLAAYQAGGMGAVHHSSIYRRQEAPAYRIVGSRFIRLLPVLQAIASDRRSPSPFVLALDGRAASGKTTAAEALGFLLSGGVIHMDDFFLPPELRTRERLSTPGGNVHYERFADEVLPQLRKHTRFSYRVFDCGQMDYGGSRDMAASPYYIIEGAYSRHPAFGDYPDLTVFVDVDSEEQMARIVRRNGVELAERFRTDWIPMEEDYFRAYQIKETADIVI